MMSGLQEDQSPLAEFEILCGLRQRTPLGTHIYLVFNKGKGIEWKAQETEQDLGSQFKFYSSKYYIILI